ATNTSLQPPRCKRPPAMKMAQQYAPHPLHALVFFAWVLAVQLTGLAAFTKGFFLTRVELGRQSQCDVSAGHQHDELAPRLVLCLRCLFCCSTPPSA
ncbi:unnamed protein product, partial [Scytosiphon promiscuus]